MKVLVTGATGFLGKQTAKRLKADGVEVTGLGRNLAQGKMLEKMGIRFFQADLSEPEALATAFRGQDSVIHCAALSSPWGKYKDFYQANVVGTANVIAAAKKAGIKRLVHVSTPSLYVDYSDRVDIREEDPLPAEGINFYSQTKRMAEDLIDQAFRDGLSVVTIRPQGIIGPGDTAILPRLLRLAKKGVLPVIGSGDNLIDLTYVDNVVESLVLALKAPELAAGKKYNITNGEPVRLYEALEEIFKSLGFSYKKKHLSFRKAYMIASALEFTCRNFLTRMEPIMTCYSVCLLGRSRTLNIEAAKRDLGYQPQVTMPQAIQKIVDDYSQRLSTGTLN